MWLIRRRVRARLRHRMPIDFLINSSLFVSEITFSTYSCRKYWSEQMVKKKMKGELCFISKGWWSSFTFRRLMTLKRKMARKYGRKLENSQKRGKGFSKKNLKKLARNSKMDDFSLPTCHFHAYAGSLWKKFHFGFNFSFISAIQRVKKNSLFHFHPLTLNAIINQKKRTAK